MTDILVVLSVPQILYAYTVDYDFVSWLLSAEERRLAYMHVNFVFDVCSGQQKVAVYFDG